MVFAPPSAGTTILAGSGAVIDAASKRTRPALSPFTSTSASTGAPCSRRARMTSSSA